MKTVGFRSFVLYLLLFVFLGGIGYFTVNFVLHGSTWAMQPYNGHLYADTEGVAEMGTITDRNGNVLAETVDGERIYSESETVRKALLHTVGDPYSNISTSVEYTMRSKLTGYNLITGLNNTPLNQFGRDVTLTLDQNACVTAYNGLNGHNGAVLVYDYKSGEILCKVSTPGFDPGNVPEDVEERNGVYVDNTISGSFTPGSIFKIVTAAAAMEKYPDTWSTRTYDCGGSYEMGGDNITCLHGDAHGTQDIYAAMGNSCNIYFAQLARDIGAEALQKKAEELGFNQSISFQSLQAEPSTIDLSGCNENQLGWAGVGQYTLLTNPYHMVTLMGAIANGGEYVQPKLTKSFDPFSSLTGTHSLMSSTEASQLKSLLRSTVSDYYGDWIFPDGLQVCAKTGTGEVGEGKSPNCWIVGFCSNEEYPYAFAVFVEEGSGGIETAGNLAASVLGALVN